MRPIKVNEKYEIKKLKKNHKTLKCFLRKRDFSITSFQFYSNCISQTLICNLFGMFHMSSRRNVQLKLNNLHNPGEVQFQAIRASRRLYTDRAEVNDIYSRPP